MTACTVYRESLTPETERNRNPNMDLSSTKYTRLALLTVNALSHIKNFILNPSNFLKNVDFYSANMFKSFSHKELPSFLFKASRSIRNCKDISTKLLKRYFFKCAVFRESTYVKFGPSMYHKHAKLSSPPKQWLRIFQAWQLAFISHIQMLK